MFIIFYHTKIFGSEAISTDILNESRIFSKTSGVRKATIITNFLFLPHAD